MPREEVGPLCETVWRLGVNWDEASTSGRGGGQTAYAKGERLGICEPMPEAVREIRD